MEGMTKVSPYTQIIVKQFKEKRKSRKAKLLERVYLLAPSCTIKVGILSATGAPQAI